MLNRGSKPVVRCAGGSSPANPRPAGAPAISIGMEGEYARRLRRGRFCRSSCEECATKHVTPAPGNQCSTDQQQMLYLPRKQNLRRLSLRAQFTLIDSAS